MTRDVKKRADEKSTQNRASPRSCAAARGRGSSPDARAEARPASSSAMLASVRGESSPQLFVSAALRVPRSTALLGPLARGLESDVYSDRLFAATVISYWDASWRRDGQLPRPEHHARPIDELLPLIPAIASAQLREGAARRGRRRLPRHGPGREDAPPVHRARAAPSGERRARASPSTRSSSGSSWTRTLARRRRTASRGWSTATHGMRPPCDDRAVKLSAEPPSPPRLAIVADRLPARRAVGVPRHAHRRRTTRSPPYAIFALVLGFAVPLARGPRRPSRPGVRTGLLRAATTAGGSSASRTRS